MKAIEQELAVRQRDTVYPKPLPEGIREVVLTALSFTTPFSLRMSLQDFQKIVNSEPADWSILDVNCISLVIKMRTAHELEMSITDWLEMQVIFEGMWQECKAIVAKMESEIKIKFMATPPAEEETVIDKEPKTIAFPVANTAQA